MFLGNGHYVLEDSPGTVFDRYIAGGRLSSHRKCNPTTQPPDSNHREHFVFSPYGIITHRGAILFSDTLFWNSLKAYHGTVPFELYWERNPTTPALDREYRVCFGLPPMIHDRFVLANNLNGKVWKDNTVWCRLRSTEKVIQPLQLQIDGENRLRFRLPPINHPRFVLGNAVMKQFESTTRWGAVWALGRRSSDHLSSR